MLNGTYPFSLHIHSGKVNGVIFAGDWSFFLALFLAFKRPLKPTRPLTQSRVIRIALPIGLSDHFLFQMLQGKERIPCTTPAHAPHPCSPSFPLVSITVQPRNMQQCALLEHGQPQIQSSFLKKSQLWSLENNDKLYRLPGYTVLFLSSQSLPRQW